MYNIEAQKNKVDVALEDSHKYSTSDSTSSNTETNWEQIDSGLSIACLIQGIDLNNLEDDSRNIVGARHETQ